MFIKFFGAFIIPPFTTVSIPVAGWVWIMPCGTQESLETPLNIFIIETLGPGLMI